jgi:hypothetical protein
VPSYRERDLLQENERRQTEQECRKPVLKISKTDKAVSRAFLFTGAGILSNYHIQNIGILPNILPRLETLSDKARN